MDKWPKDKLISEVTRQNEQLKYYQTKLRDLVTAYKSLVTEKEVLESSFKALNNVCNDQLESSGQTTTDSSSSSTTVSVDESSCNTSEEQTFSAELTTLMNSLSALSAEKCRMEASFQAEKKLLRQAKDKSDLLIRELKDKIKKNCNDGSKEIEQLKSRLIIERHEREKERNDHGVMIRELQRVLSQERVEKEHLERTLSEMLPKFEILSNKEESDRYRETDMSEKFLNLQKKHLNILEAERKKIQHNENESKEQIAIYECHVASLEGRLAELSHTVVDYHRLKQQDQNEITKLKAHIEELSKLVKNPIIGNDTQEDSEVVERGLKDKSETELAAYVKRLVDKLLHYKCLVLNANEYCEKPLDVHSMICNNCTLANSITTKESPSVPLEVHQKLLVEMDSLKQQSLEWSKRNGEMDSLKIKVRVLLDQTSVLNDQMEDTIHRYEKQLESIREQHRLVCIKHDTEVSALHQNYKAQITELETQIQKQRDRTLALLDEKDQEVSTLKSSFQLFMPGNKQSLQNHSPRGYMKQSQLGNVLEGTTPGHNAHESPHILHYAHELARRDVEITNLRKTCCQLESSLRDINKEFIFRQQETAEQEALLNDQISRLERCQSREGANLEYLKNVIVNYLQSKQENSKCHMLNAIAAVLKFSDSEMKKIKSSI